MHEHEKTGGGNCDAWTPNLLLIHLRELISANDARYVDKFDSSEKAVATAFASSEKAIRDTLAAVEKSTAAAFVAAEKAVKLAEENAERWREDAAAERRRVTERERDLATKTEVSSLKERLDRGEGSSGGMRDMYGWVFGAVIVILAVATFLLRSGGVK